MSLPRSEPGLMKVARGVGNVAPFLRKVVVKGMGRVCGYDRPFMAKVGRRGEEGMVFQVDMGERVSRHLYLFGEIERVVTGVFESVLREGDTVLDVGANFGYFTVVGARKVGEKGRVISFEPDPRNLVRLRNNVEANGLKNVRVVDRGLFDREDVLKFHLAGAGEDNMGTSSLKSAGSGREVIEVPVVSLDGFLAKEEVGEIGLMKMDIEGAEVEAIAGAAETLRAGRVRNILMEIHQAIIGHEAAGRLVGELRGMGYVARLVDEKARGNEGRLVEFGELPGVEEHDTPHVLFSLNC